MRIDSVTTMKILGVLQRRTGIALPASLLCQYPTTRAIGTRMHALATSQREQPQGPHAPLAPADLRGSSPESR
ncbi:acyl carrier protein [Streptomyces sp. NPDC059918]|uniref:acyl carrier protein n=1 Tax=unclassified Streptomyces TaxID=2593676 RepID=UPI003653590B